MLAVRWLSAITMLLVLVQAALIGQALYLGEMSLLALHGWLGSGSFLASAFVISVIALYYDQKCFDLKTFWLALGIAVVSTITELICSKGLDNLFIPLSVVFMLLIFM